MLHQTNAAMKQYNIYVRWKYGSLNWLQYHPPYFICLLFYLFILTFFLSFHPPPIFPPLPPLPSLPSTPLSKATNKSSLNSHLLQQQSFQLLFTIFHSFFICTVNNPYQTICAFKIISPIRSQRLLPTNIPNIKLKSEGMERGNMYIYVNYIYIMSDLGAEEITNIYIYNVYISYDIHYSLCSNVLILKPSVGDIVSMSSPLNFFKIVVLPALSRPLQQC